MYTKTQEPIQVLWNSGFERAKPLKISWKKRVYVITKVGLHHTYWDGETLHHIFSVVADNLFFKLKLNSDTLTWTLEEVSDGQD